MSEEKDKSQNNLDLSETERQIQNRAPRFESHALVEIKTGWMPFSHASAVLLDLSLGGFKIEFVNPVKIKTNVPMTMSIPLAPFQILSPAKLKTKIVIKWYDPKQLRAGGIFENIGNDHYLFERILQYIAEHNERHGPLFKQ